MRHSSNHYQLATLAHAILNTLTNPNLVVHAEYLYSMVTKVETLATLTKSQYDSELERLIKCGFVIEERKSSVYRISVDGMQMKKAMNKQRNS